MIEIYTLSDPGFAKSSFSKKKLFGTLFKMACCCLFLMLPALAKAQTVVNGTVKDKDGPIMGATVTEKGAKNSTTTDLNGKFKITVKSSSDILVVSYIGYKTQEVSSGSADGSTITLQEDLNKLNEVVVVGYGSVKKSDLTGSVSSVKASDLHLGGTT